MSNLQVRKTATLLSCASALVVSWACSSEQKPPLYFDPPGGGMGGRPFGGANAQGGSLAGSMMNMGGTGALPGAGTGAIAGAGAGGGPVPGAGGMGNQGGFAGGFDGPEAGGAAGAPNGQCVASPNCMAYCRAASETTSCPRSYDKCVCQCEERLQASCSVALSALNTCGGSNPVAECVPQELVVGCEKQSFDLSICSAKSQGAQCLSELPACRTYCEAWLLTRCPVTFDSTMPACLCFCDSMHNQSGPQCATEFATYMACTGNAPQLSCNQDGQVAANNCITEWTALRACIAAP